MKSEQNIQSWLETAPKEVCITTEELLQTVNAMRAEEVIYPAQDNILNAISYTAPQEVKVVILGQDPYHEPGQAMGLSFSVPQGQKLPPSLKNIYKEMAADLGCDQPTSGDLTSWAEQGVLLLNTTLTVREHAANSHSKLGWQVLTSYLIQRCIELPQPIVFMGWGTPAITLIEKARAAAESATDNKFCLASTHPSPLSANRSTSVLHSFMGSRPSSQANMLPDQNTATPLPWASAAPSVQETLF